MLFMQYMSGKSVEKRDVIMWKGILLSLIHIFCNGADIELFLQVHNASFLKFIQHLILKKINYNHFYYDKTKL